MAEKVMQVEGLLQDASPAPPTVHGHALALQAAG